MQLGDSQISVEAFIAFWWWISHVYASWRVKEHYCRLFNIEIKSDVCCNRSIYSFELFIFQHQKLSNWIRVTTGITLRWWRRIEKVHILQRYSLLCDAFVRFSSNNSECTICILGRSNNCTLLNRNRIAGIVQRFFKNNKIKKAQMVRLPDYSFLLMTLIFLVTEYIRLYIDIHELHRRLV